MEDGDEMRETEDIDGEDEQSLSRSVSQMTTRGEATQPDEELQVHEINQISRNAFHIHNYTCIFCRKTKSSCRL